MEEESSAGNVCIPLPVRSNVNISSQVLVETEQQYSYSINVPPVSIKPVNAPKNKANQVQAAVCIEQAVY